MIVLVTGGEGCWHRCGMPNASSISCHAATLTCRLLSCNGPSACQTWLRDKSLLSATALGKDKKGKQPPSPPPPSFICGVYINHNYKFIFIRNRKTASSSFLTAIRTFMQVWASGVLGAHVSTWMGVAVRTHAGSRACMLGAATNPCLDPA